LMKTAPAIHPASLTLNVALQTPAQVRVYHTVILPNHDEVERRLCEFDGRVAWRHAVQSVCCEMLTIAGLGILLYSAAILL
jgi:hypothetical protein